MIRKIYFGYNESDDDDDDDDDDYVYNDYGESHSKGK
jgi:hypothetical protein